MFWPESPQVNLLCTKYTYTHLGLRYISVHHTHPNIKHVLHRGCVVPNRQHFAHCICTQNYGRATYYYHHDMYTYVPARPAPKLWLFQEKWLQRHLYFFSSQHTHCKKKISMRITSLEKLELSWSFLRAKSCPNNWHKSVSGRKHTANPNPVRLIGNSL